jgi:4'-phosphopantetheinyl transferase
VALHLLKNTPDYQLGIWKIEEEVAELFALSGFAELPGYSNVARRLEYLAVRVLAGVFGIRPDEILYRPSGKPYLKDNTGYISISHTKSYVAFLRSSHPLVGVDIEQRSERIRRVRHKFMHPEEEARLKALSPDATAETLSLLLHWCAKESLFKAIPENGVDFAQELRILNLSLPAQGGQFTGRAIRSDVEFRIDYIVEPDFTLTCCFSAESK